MGKTYNISKAAEKIGVSVKTLQRWDRDGKLIANRTPSNRRYYTENQLRSIKEGEFEVRDMIDVVKCGYDNMKKRGMRIEGANIMGHIVNDFCTMQDANRDRFFDNYDYITIGGKGVYTCDIIIGGEFIMSIITSPEETSDNATMKWLYNYMKKTTAPRGIVIKDTKWNMVDIDGTEYRVDFEEEVNEKIFEKFLI